MKKLPFILILIVFIADATGGAQARQFVVERSNSSYTYNNKPITPEALLPFLPGPELGDTVRPWVVNLKDNIYTQRVSTDTFYPGFYICNIDTTEPFDEGAILYKVIKKIKDDIFVLWVNEQGGTMNTPFIFILKLKDDKIYRIGSFSAEAGDFRNPDLSVKIKGNEIINGDIHFKIPN